MNLNFTTTILICLLFLQHVNAQIHSTWTALPPLDHNKIDLIYSSSLGSEVAYQSSTNQFLFRKEKLAPWDFLFFFSQNQLLSLNIGDEDQEFLYFADLTEVTEFNKKNKSFETIFYLDSYDNTVIIDIAINHFDQFRKELFLLTNNGLYSADQYPFGLAIQFQIESGYLLKKNEFEYYVISEGNNSRYLGIVNVSTNQMTAFYPVPHTGSKVLISENGHLIADNRFSLDGLTWHYFQGIPDRDYDNTVVNGSNIFIQKDSVIYYSTDNGAIWDSTFILEKITAIYPSKEGSIILTIEYPDQTELHYYTDFPIERIIEGSTAERKRSDLIYTGYNGNIIVRSSNDYYSFIPDDSIFIPIPNNLDWFDLQAFSRNEYLLFHSYSPGHWLLAKDGVFQSADYGKHWERISTILFNDHPRIVRDTYFYLTYDRLFFSTDGGITWPFYAVPGMRGSRDHNKWIVTNKRSIIKVPSSPINNSLIRFDGNDQQITSIYPEGFGYASYDGIEYCSEHSIIYIFRWSSPHSRIFRSSNDGQNFEPVDFPFPGQQILKLISDDSGAVIVLTDNEVFLKNAPDEDWKLITGNLPQNVSFTDISIGKNRHIYISSQRDRVFRSDYKMEEIVLMTPNRETVKAFKLDLFPNPANDYIELNIDNLFDVSNAEIMDIMGNVHKSITLGHSEERIFIGDLFAGIYIIRVVAGGKSYISRFIKL